MEILLSNNVIDASTINWHNDIKTILFSIQQKVGFAYALGKTKFVFPNDTIIFVRNTLSKNIYIECKRSFRGANLLGKKPTKQAFNVLLNNINWRKEKVQTIHKNNAKSSN